MQSKKVVRFFLVLLAAVALVGCGSDDNNGAQGVNGKWTQQEFATALNRCVTSGVQNGYGPQQVMSSYCSCIYTDAARQVTFQVYAQNFQQITQQQQQRGVYDQCWSAANRR